MLLNDLFDLLFHVRLLPIDCLVVVLEDLLDLYFELSLDLLQLLRQDAGRL